MDSSSAQGNHETGQGSPPRETTSTQENEIGSGCWTSEATEEKHTSSTEYVYKESAEAWDADFKYDGAEQLSPLHGDLTRNSSCEQLAPQPEDTTLNYNSVQLGLLTEDEAGQKLSAKQAMSEINNNIVRESVNSEALVEKQKVGTELVQNGPAETEMVEFDYLGLEQSGPRSDDVTKKFSWGQLRPTPEDGGKSCLENLGLAPEDAAVNTSLEQLKPLPDNLSKNCDLKQLELPPEDAANNPSLEDAANNLEDDGKSSLEQLGLPPEDAAANTSLEQLNPLPDIPSKNSDLKPLEPPPEDAANNLNLEDAAKNPKDEGNSSLEQLGLPPEDATMNASLKQLKTLSDNLFENCDLKPLELPPEDAASKPSKSGSRGRRTSAKSTKGNHVLRSSVGSARVLRSRSQEKSKAPEPINNLPEHGDGANGEKRRKKKKQKKEIPVDEFSRIRKHLRYLLNRRNYEQNLIDAYSGEGWKGLSLEKIKPEKELQRAKSEIFRCKLKIRDLFQRLDLLIAEGKLPESVFDSEGQIDSEDIFCAKCGSKDLEADNDIILCDGACERAFHQFCLEPPLLKEDIPPDDEGWLCPGCDCKVDCVDLLNDSQGTNLSVLDTWEKVFPEAAAAAAAGNKLDDNFGLPSDDSEDNDYNPDGLEGDEEVEGDESSSDESDFSSASEDFGALLNNKQNLELPSDDSEDDEYDPDAPDLDEQDKQESSSSDFTSDSEDFSVASDDKGPSYKVEPMPAPSDRTKPFRGSNGERSKVGWRKKNSFNDELSSLLESGPGQGESAGVSGRRLVERLDYKKLYDETYGNVSSDSSDDEVWVDAADAPRKRRKNYSDKIASASPGVRTPIKERTNAKDINHNREESEHTPKRRARKQLHVEGTNHSPAKSYKVSSEPGSSSTKRSPYQRLGEAVTQGLVKSFKENQYPERAAKENLAKELGITAYQVSKWFENARWSFRHTSRMESVLSDSVPSKGTPPRTSVSKPGPKAATEDLGNGIKTKERSKVNAGVTTGTPITEETSRQRSTTPRGRKRRNQSEHQGSDGETKKQGTPVNSAKAQKVQKRARPAKARGVRKKGRARGRKSAA